MQIAVDANFVAHAATFKVKVNVKVRIHLIVDIAPLHELPPQKCWYGTCSKGISQFYLCNMFIHIRNEPYLPLPSQL